MAMREVKAPDKEGKAG